MLTTDQMMKCKIWMKPNFQANAAPILFPVQISNKPYDA